MSNSHFLIANSSVEISPEPDDTFINITEPSGKYDFEVSSQQNQVQWYLKYASYPSIETLEFRDKNKEVVPWMSGFDTDTRKKIEAKRESRRITVLIRNISIADSGTYTLYANNGKMDRERRIELKVKGTILLTFNVSF